MGVRWAGYVARVDEIRSSYKISVGKVNQKKSPGRPRRRWEGIKIDVKETVFADFDWIHLVSYRQK
jgi:hypothetical protein